MARGQEEPVATPSAGSQAGAAAQKATESPRQGEDRPTISVIGGRVGSSSVSVSGTGTGTTQTRGLMIPTSLEPETSGPAKHEGNFGRQGAIDIPLRQAMDRAWQPKTATPLLVTLPPRKSSRASTPFSTWRPSGTSASHSMTYRTAKTREPTRCKPWRSTGPFSPRGQGRPSCRRDNRCLPDGRSHWDHGCIARPGAGCPQPGCVSAAVDAG